jgi:hypothetical protein
MLICSVTMQSLTAQETGAWIRINQAGYLPGDIKVAVFISKEETTDPSGFRILDMRTGDCVFSGSREDGLMVLAPAEKWGMGMAYRLNFSNLQKEGGYRISIDLPGKGRVESPGFRIGTEVYEGTADFLLTYMRQQRCGDNPFLDAQCHQHDGYIVLHPERTGEKIDVTGGWHDATDYLQYLTTSANATFQMMFAYTQAEDKTVFGDRFDATGRPGANGIPDILDEIRWGLEWLLKMNPEDKVMFNQIADDRDQWVSGFLSMTAPITGGVRTRSSGVFHYRGKAGSGRTHQPDHRCGLLGREVCLGFCPGSGVVQRTGPGALGKNENENTAGVCVCGRKARQYPDVLRGSPYFYEEDNYVDDIQLAAAVFHHLEAGRNGWKKPITGGSWKRYPLDGTGPCQALPVLPLINLEHYYLAASDTPMAEKYTEYMRRGLEHIRQRGESCAFRNGVPFMWCSNNMVAAAISQADLYYRITGDETYREMEASLRDWLFGCNPWGTSMIVDFPKGGDYPERPHTSYLPTLGKSTPGGLIDGPQLRERLKDHSQYISLADGAESYAPFNQGVALYHDEIWDYATNEPTMDGTASLSYYLARRETDGRKEAARLRERNTRPATERDNRGGIVRMNPGSREIYLAFTADERFEGGLTVLETLKKHGIKSSFFLTGNCLRNPQWQDLVQEVISQGHYVGPHGDRHLLYAPWEGDVEKSLVSPDSLRSDISDNMAELARAGVDLSQVRWFMPSYEHFNTETVRVTASMGMELIHLTPGILTRADYTTPDMPPTEVPVN